MKSFTHGITLALCALLIASGCGGSKPAAPAATSAPAATTAPAKPVEAKMAEAKPVAEAVPAAAPAPAAAATPAPAAPAAPASPTGDAKYVISANDDSSLTWTGYGGLMGHMDGGFANFNGAVTANPADFSTTKVDLTVDMKTIFSTSGGLTTKLRDEHFFNTSKFATAKFVSTGVAKEGEKYNVSGNVEILGATRNVTFPATIEIKNDKLHATAEFTINRNDWGIVYQGTGDSFIEDKVLIKFDILCDPAK